ncbi:kinase-associated lipoprotein B [Oceanobacillus saliphilus]|uniref:kinase-associated lipoprotein B n=1 Tax=Oceanobacillus saliphilus TaxID=2925834 RepID=UPI00201E10F0|nr:kinase-associated lipoprotein B [Oceanobacillus saliphilus]
MAEVKIGDTVKAHYHSGTYIGEVIEDRGANYLIEVLAVLKHPLQGDLHNYGKLEDVFFHERKALAHHEKMNVKKAAVHSFEGEIPPYGKSLKEAVKNYRQKLVAEDHEFNKQSLLKLNSLEKHYY